jgi:hypothetical protein
VNTVFAKSKSKQSSTNSTIMLYHMIVPHVKWAQGMACPQVMDVGKGLWEWWVTMNIVKKQLHIADKRWSSSFGVEWRLTPFHHKKQACYTVLRRVLGLHKFYGSTQAMEYGHKIWNLKCWESLQVSSKRIKIHVSGSTGGDMGQEWH